VIFLKWLKDVITFALGQVDNLARAQLGARRQFTLKLRERFTEDGVAIFKLNLENMPAESLKIRSYSFKNYDGDVHDSGVYYDNIYAGGLMSLMNEDVPFPFRGPSVMAIKLPPDCERTGKEEIELDLAVTLRG
jgi:hypothetical protein